MSGIRVEMPTRMRRPMHRAERSPGRVDIGTHRYSNLQPQVRRDAEHEELAEMAMSADLHDDSNTQQELDDGADVHGGADGGAHGEDGGAQPRKRRKKRTCALCHTVSSKLSPVQIRAWLGGPIILRPDKCSGKGSGQVGVSNCKHFRRTELFTDGTEHSRRTRNNALGNITAICNGSRCPYALETA